MLECGMKGLGIGETTAIFNTSQNLAGIILIKTQGLGGKDIAVENSIKETKAPQRKIPELFHILSSHELQTV